MKLSEKSEYHQTLFGKIQLLSSRGTRGISLRNQLIVIHILERGSSTSFHFGQNDNSCYFFPIFYLSTLILLNLSPTSTVSIVPSFLPLLRLYRIIPHSYPSSLLSSQEATGSSELGILDHVHAREGASSHARRHTRGD